MKYNTPNEIELIKKKQYKRGKEMKISKITDIRLMPIANRMGIMCNKSTAISEIPGGIGHVEYDEVSSEYREQLSAIYDGIQNQLSRIKPCNVWDSMDIYPDIARTEIDFRKNVIIEICGDDIQILLNFNENVGDVIIDNKLVDMSMVRRRMIFFDKVENCVTNDRYYNKLQKLTEVFAMI